MPYHIFKFLIFELLQTIALFTKSLILNNIIYGTKNRK